MISVPVLLIVHGIEYPADPVVPQMVAVAAVQRARITALIVIIGSVIVQSMVRIVRSDAAVIISLQS